MHDDDAAAGATVPGRHSAHVVAPVVLATAPDSRDSKSVIYAVSVLLNCMLYHTILVLERDMYT